MKKEPIETRICRCGAPIHWTFLFAGSEYLCMNCRKSEGMMGAGQIVNQTTDIRAMQKVCKDVFKALRKHMHGSGGFTRRGCKKCKGTNEYHPQHASKYELSKNEMAIRIFEAMRGKIVKSN